MMDEDRAYDAERWQRWKLAQIWRLVAIIVVEAVLIALSFVVFAFHGGLGVVLSILGFLLLFISAFERLGHILDEILELAAEDYEL